jgi:hypothetical protein
MAGGLLNIVAIGNNNVILTGNPTKTFFKAVYSKYTNFGLQKFRIDFDGMRDLRLTEPSVFTFKIPRYAELLMDTYLAITLPNIWSPIYQPVPPNPNVPDAPHNNNTWAPYEFRWIRDLGTQIIKEVTITCGSQLIQKYSGQYLNAMVERDFTKDKKDLFNKMSGNIDELNNPANAYNRVNVYPSAYYSGNTAGAEPSIRGRQLFIPINTWFTLNSRCAFPLVSLQYNELIITVTLRPIQELFQVRDVFDTSNNFPYMKPDFNLPRFQMYRFLQTPPSVNINPEYYTNTITTWNADVHLISTYCFLSKEEAQLFANDDQVYLIKDVFEYNFYNIIGSSKLSLTSTGMVANWMWFLQRNDVNMRNEWSNYTNWPYHVLPVNLLNAPADSPLKSIMGYGPYYNPNPIGTATYGNNTTGIFITGPFIVDNQKEILETMAILLNGDYRENVLPRGIYDYVEKYVRTPGFAKDGIYCYNFCLNTSPYEYQPSGAINLSKFKNIELELTTFIPNFDTINSSFQITCDGNGNPIGTNKSTWRLYEYNFNLTLFEERYNVLSFVGGNCAMLYAR